MNLNSLKNLKAPWQKGSCGNPDPSRNGYSVTSRVKDLLAEVSDFIPPDANPNDKKYRDQIARQMIIESCRGNVPMIRELLDRTEGKVPDKTAIIGDILIEVVFSDNRNKAADQNPNSLTAPSLPPG